jgi:hypothetical protein
LEKIAQNVENFFLTFKNLDKVNPGLPDGMFSNQKSHIGKILEGLAIEDVGIFMTIWNILWPFDIIYGRLVQFVVIWYIFSLWFVLTMKNLATLQ